LLNTMINDEIERYHRQIILPQLGKEGQEKLKASSVLVVGCGGLGCPVLLYLAAAGIGRIGLMDNDTVAMSNLHRQVLYINEDIGKMKAVVAAEKLAKQNPFSAYIKYPFELTKNNSREIISGYDIVVDCPDNFSTRYLVSDVCSELSKPHIFGSVNHFEGQVSVFNFQNSLSYRSLFPESPVSDHDSEIGIMGILPGIIGLIMATETIKIITGIGKVLSGKVLRYDALNMTFETFTFSGTPDAGY
jgi:sulfur-carrier protein adenylyltransferase/sulfurtransferase